MTRPATNLRDGRFTTTPPTLFTIGKSDIDCLKDLANFQHQIWDKMNFKLQMTSTPYPLKCSSHLDLLKPITVIVEAILVGRKTWQSGGVRKEERGQKNFKCHLLLIQQTNHNQTSQECFFGGPLSKRSKDLNYISNFDWCGIRKRNQMPKFLKLFFLISLFNSKILFRNVS